VARRSAGIVRRAPRGPKKVRACDSRPADRAGPRCSRFSIQPLVLSSGLCDGFALWPDGAGGHRSRAKRSRRCGSLHSHSLAAFFRVRRELFARTRERRLECTLWELLCQLSRLPFVSADQSESNAPSSRDLARLLEGRASFRTAYRRTPNLKSHDSACEKHWSTLVPCPCSPHGTMQRSRSQLNHQLRLTHGYLVCLFAFTFRYLVGG
jgi:hypothetical protein